MAALYIDLFFGFFNVFFGSMMFFTGVGFIKPKKPISQNTSLLLTLGGGALILFGFVKIVISYRDILQAS